MDGIKTFYKKSKTKFNFFGTWQLFLILIPLLFAAATAYRLDHLKMTELKKAIISADHNNSKTEEIQRQLDLLRSFVASHTVITALEQNGQQFIVFGSGPFYLEGLYHKDAAKAIKAAEDKLRHSNSPHGNIFAKAMAICKPQAIKNRWNWNTPAYLNCMTGEISKYPPSTSAEDGLIANLPNPALYRFDFASPIWSPTPSGFLAILSLLLIVVIFIRLLIWGLLRLSLLFL